MPRTGGGLPEGATHADHVVRENSYISPRGHESSNHQKQNLQCSCAFHHPFACGFLHDPKMPYYVGGSQEEEENSRQEHKVSVKLSVCYHEL